MARFILFLVGDPAAHGTNLTLRYGNANFRSTFFPPFFNSFPPPTGAPRGPCRELIWVLAGRFFCFFFVNLTYPNPPLPPAALRVRPYGACDGRVPAFFVLLYFTLTRPPLALLVRLYGAYDGRVPAFLY